ITTNAVADQLSPESPTVVSWALNNHWMVNFKASQDGEIPQRYRLTTHAGACDAASANRFAEHVATPPIVLRDYLRADAPATGRFLDVPDDAPIEAVLVPGRDGSGVILRLRGVEPDDAQISLRFARTPREVRHSSLLEEYGGPLALASDV